MLILVLGQCRRSCPTMRSSSSTLLAQPAPEPREPKTAQAMVLRLTGIDITVCRVCGRPGGAVDRGPHRIGIAGGELHEHRIPVPRGGRCVHESDAPGSGAHGRRDRHGPNHGLPSRPACALDVACEPRVHRQPACPGLGFGRFDAFEQHLLVIASHAEHDAPALHPGECVGASRSTVDQVAQCEEAVTVRLEPEVRECRFERREFSVHVAGDEVASAGGILPYPYGGPLEMLSWHRLSPPRLRNMDFVDPVVSVAGAAVVHVGFGARSAVLFAARRRLHASSAKISSSRSAWRSTSSGVVGASCRFASSATARGCVCGVSHNARSSAGAPFIVLRASILLYARRSARSHPSIGLFASIRSRIQLMSVGTASASRSAAATCST